MDISVFSPAARKVVERIVECRYEAFFVGGCVRDVLLGRIVKDFDVATSAHPSQVTSIFRSVVPTGLQHGTVTVLDYGEPVEVTTYRIDKGYSDGRRPDSVEFTSRIEEDLSRRDFTINAIAVGLDGMLRDPWGGTIDLQNRIVRAVGAPDIRFQEDALRILRALRFASQLGFTIDSVTERAMAKNATNLELISRERIGQEMMKIAESSWWHISSLLSEGPWLVHLGQPFDQLRRAFAILSSGKYRFEVWEHWIGEFAPRSPQSVAAVTFALWFHIADMTGSENNVKEIGNLLVWTKKMRQDVAQLLRIMKTDPAQWTRDEWARRLYDYPSWLVLWTCRIFDFIEGDDGEPRKKMFDCQLVKQPIFSLKDLAVTGRDLTHQGITGPDVGRTLEKLVTLVLSGNIENTKHALLSSSPVKVYRGKDIEPPGIDLNNSRHGSVAKRHFGDTSQCGWNIRFRSRTQCESKRFQNRDMEAHPRS